MLLYRDGFFIQALEGEQHDVDALYDKIKSDPRHTNVLKVYEYEIDHTDFGAWSMGFNKISAEDMDTIPGFSDFLNSKQDPETYFSTPSRAVKLLAAFKERTYF